MERPWAPARPGLSLLLTITAGLNLLPFAALLAFSLQGGNGVLGIGNDGLTQLSNTVLLVLLVGIGVACLGTAIGWLTACCNFAGKRWLTLAQLLPLATPAYLQAAVLTGFRGPRRCTNQWSQLVHSGIDLANVPYVVLLSRDNFRLSGRRQLEASRSLGLGAWRSFSGSTCRSPFQPSPPALPWPAWKWLNEYGAVELLALPTLSTGLLERWQGQDDPPGAVALALTALAVVAVLVAAEQWQRRKSRRWDMGGPTDASEGWRLQGWRARGAQLLCALPPLISVGLPLVWLLRSLDQLRQDSWAELLVLGSHSLVLAVVGAGLATAMALILAIGKRWISPGPLGQAMFTASLGYAVPGTVLAIALLLLLAPLGFPPLLLLIFGYGNRFIAVAKGGLDAGLERLAPSVDEAATSLGESWRGVLRRVHLPLLRSPLLLGALLVFVDTVKELPLTFALRPFDFDTLAVRVFQYAGDERLGAAIAPALLIMLLGLAATLLLIPKLSRGSTGVASPPAN